MNPPPKDQEPLARWTTSVLRQVPDAPAPAGFTAQVLAEIRRRANLPWYRRPWLQWPARHRWMSLVVLAGVLLGVFGFGVPELQDAAAQSPFGQRFMTVWDDLGALPAIASAITRAARLAAAQISSTHIALTMATLAAAWVSTLGLGAACWRIAGNSR